MRVFKWKKKKEQQLEYNSYIVVCNFDYSKDQDKFKILISFEKAK